MAPSLVQRSRTTSPITVWRHVRVDRLPSVRTRVTLGATAILAIALMVAALSAAGLVRRSLTADVETTLVDRVDEVDDLISNGLLTTLLEPTGREVGQVQVVDADRMIVAVTPGLAGSERLDVVDPPAVGQQVSVNIDATQIDGDTDETYRLVTRTVASPAGPLTIYAVTSLDAAQRAERYLRNALLYGIPVFVLLVAWLIHRVVGRALEPVDAMRAEVDRIEATDLSGRVRASTRDDEVSRLGLTLNRMLGRLEESDSRQKMFAAAASHELRSPLSAIRTELEVGLQYPDRAVWSDVARDALTEVARLETLARDLRVLTRSNAIFAAERAQFDLTELIASEIARRRPARAIRYVTSLRPGSVFADADAAVRVVRNLLDNAERHAASEITVTVEQASAGVELAVANDGEAILAADRERIFEAFSRLDEARALDTGGSGLGLAIARSLMQSSEGRLDLADAESGVRFVATFPTAPHAWPGDRS